MELTDFDKLTTVEADDRGRVTIGSEFANETVQVCVLRYPDRDELEAAEEPSDEKKRVLSSMYSWGFENGIEVFDARPEDGIVIDTDGNEHETPYQLEESTENISESDQ